MVVKIVLNFHGEHDGGSCEANCGDDGDCGC